MFTRTNQIPVFRSLWQFSSPQGCAETRSEWVLRGWADGLQDAWARARSAMARLGIGKENKHAPDLKLARRAQLRGPEGERAFRDVVSTHQQWMVHFLISMLGNQADAEDVAQDTFVRAYLALSQYRGEASLKSWLRRIATNTAFNSRRRSRPIATGQDFTAVADTHDAARALAARDALLKVLDDVPYTYREILVLYHMEEMELQEVALTLNIGLSAAKMRLKRAREKFLEVYTQLTEPE